MDSPRGGVEEEEAGSDNSMSHYHNFTLKDKVIKEIMKTHGANEDGKIGKPPQQPVMTSIRKKKMLEAERNKKA